MPSEYQTIILLSFLSVISTGMGIGLALLCAKCFQGRKIIAFGISFSAGIMLLISIFELVPKSAQEAGIISAALMITVGALSFALVNALLPHFHLVQEKRMGQSRFFKTALLVALGLVIHDFPEGFAMANSYIVSPQLGVLIALGIAIHNIPEEFAIALPLVMLKRKKMLFGAGLLSILAEPAGAIAGILVAHYFSMLNFVFLSLAAGAMIFISLHELFPEALRCRQWSALAAGLITSIAIYLILVKFTGV